MNKFGKLGQHQTRITKKEQIVRHEFGKVRTKWLLTGFQKLYRFIREGRAQGKKRPNNK